MKKLVLGICFLVCGFVCSAQCVDSLKIKETKKLLDGCWDYSKDFSFKFSKKSGTGWQTGNIKTSAPFFVIVFKDGCTYIDWVEITGGGDKQKIISIDEKKLVLLRDNGEKVVYKRAKKCK